MGEQREVHLARGIVAGIVGGLVASWVMNEFIGNLGPQIQKAVASGKPQQPQDGEKPDDATMKTADAVVATLTGGRHLSHEEKEKGGPIVHYAFGALMGAVYGAIVEEMPAATIGLGTAFGTALFTGADAGRRTGAESLAVVRRRTGFVTGYSVRGASCLRRSY